VSRGRRRVPRRERPLLGVVHLRALPSAAAHTSMADVFAAAMADARALVAGGVDGVVVENFGDAPFHKGDRSDPVPPDVPAALAIVAHAVRTELGVPVAVNCLRNDGIGALGAAAAAGARWVRAAYVTDQGLIEGEAARLFAYRRRLHSDVEVLADFLVKHAVPLAPVDIAVAAKDLAERSGAAGLVLSGARTGEPVDAAFFDTVRAAVAAFPIWIGSGLTVDNAAELWPRCDGAIVGTALKHRGEVDAPVDRARVRALRRACPRLHR
jgi:membrane complex biogenesis BtpA family protein